MIKDIKSLAVFHSVIKNNGFSKAAIELKMTPTGVSQHVSKLEESLGFTLMYRSTRSFSLTEKGEAVAQMASNMISTLEEGYSQLNDKRAQLAGKLKISLPLFDADDEILPSIWDFSRQHKAVKLELDFSDYAVDLTRDGFDMAIRYGSLVDSSLKASKIGSFNVIPICAKSYMNGREQPKTPKDLAKLDYISIGAKIKSNRFINSDKQTTFTPQNERIELNSVDQALSAIKSDLGYSFLPEFVCRTGLKSGTVVRLIPDWQIPEFGIFAIRPKDARKTDLSAKLLEHLQNAKMISNFK